MIRTKLEIVLNDSEDESLSEYGWTDFYFDPKEVAGFNESGKHDDCTTVMFRGGERYVLAIPMSWFEKRYPKTEDVICARIKYETE